jgi:polyhydroxyalkanoate synthesis regulator phasin
VRSDLSARIDEVRRELIELITATRAELTHRQDALNARMDEIARDMTKIYDVLVRREDYERLREQVQELERKIAELTR